MSSFNVESLLSASDPNIPSFLREAENGLLANINHDTALEFGKLGKGFQVVNNDTLNNLTVRLHNVLGTAIIIPPSSSLELQEWFTQIFFQPDGVTGNFQFSLELCNKLEKIFV